MSHVKNILMGIVLMVSLAACTPYGLGMGHGGGMNGGMMSQGAAPAMGSGTNPPPCVEGAPGSIPAQNTPMQNNCVPPTR